MTKLIAALLLTVGLLGLVPVAAEAATMADCEQARLETSWLIEGAPITCVTGAERDARWGVDSHVAGWYQSDEDMMYVVAADDYDLKLLKAVIVHEYGHRTDWAVAGAGVTWFSRSYGATPYSLEPYAQEYAWLYADVEYRGWRTPSATTLPSFDVLYGRLLLGYYGPIKMQRDIRRVYLASFRREPDEQGMAYWVARQAKGTSMTDIAEFFAWSPEFLARYGNLSNRGFVEAVYRNVLWREGDQAGVDYWTWQLDTGRSRGWLVAQFADSAEFRWKVG